MNIKHELLKIAKLLTADGKFLRDIEEYIFDVADEQDLVFIEKVIKIKRNKLKRQKWAILITRPDGTSPTPAVAYARGIDGQTLLFDSKQEAQQMADHYNRSTKKSLVYEAIEYNAF